jgi:hypothetical protein
MIDLGIDPGTSGAIAALFANHNEPDRGDSKRKQGASSMFTFGDSSGYLRGLLVAYKIPFVRVAPSKWPSSFGLVREKDEKTSVTKNRNRAKAQQIYPHVEIPLWKADALLLATYCRQNHAQLF